MPQPELTPIQRLVLAVWALFAILFRADVAAAVARVREARRLGQALPSPEPSAAPATVQPPRAVEPVPPPPPARPAAPPAAEKAAAAPPGKAAATAAALAPVPEAAAPAPVTAPAPAAPAPARAPEPQRGPDPRGALQLLALLQREGRLVDFVEEDLTGFPDASIGAAARTVHAGCKRAIEELFRLEAVFREPEGAKVTVAPGFDAGAIRLTGNVVGQPPFQGALRHHGWRAREVKLPVPADGKDLAIVAPAEVEL